LAGAAAAGWLQRAVPPPPPPLAPTAALRRDQRDDAALPFCVALTPESTPHSVADKPRGSVHGVVVMRSFSLYALHLCAWTPFHHT
jgi:hypothetical protein